MVRVVAGTFRSRRLVTPRSRGVRPTADRVKEALFQILGDRVAGAAVLDLYAGGGGLGIEALSRGAASCVFVERDPACRRAIRANVAALGLGGAARLVAGDAARAVRALAARGERFGLVLADPPYAKAAGARSEMRKVLCALDACDMYEPRALVVVEHAARDEAPAVLGRLRPVRERRYGDTVLSFFEAPGGPPPRPRAGGGPSE
ncbi:MAG: 16S rRNA (guanine(966)-N(2))-methyltransferase RsmD [bacterium]|nr:16S rRNA (guanine(966)-N(2))-methyltransferase RsmD [bacterium]